MNRLILKQKFMQQFDRNQIADLRVDYALKEFDINDISSDPFKQFEKWFHEAVTARVNEPNAMTLATVKPDGTPSARIVLLKGLQDHGFTFFTNYDSGKGKEMMQNHNVALVFCWLELQRQIRIEGTVEKLSAAESDVYFVSRPRKSQISAHASSQSMTLKNREELEKNYQKLENLFLDKTVTRPDNWGGYIVKPKLIEFWQGRQSRLHDRFRYIKADNMWKISRLAP